MSAIDLTAAQYAALRTVFARYAEELELVAVYGSRVQGRARPGSDVDLVLHGLSAPDTLPNLRHDLSESDLSIFADVIDYSRIDYEPLKREVDRWAVPLFTRSDLIAANRAHAA